MSDWADSVLVILVLTNLALLGSSRLGTCIRIAALQGIALGFLPLLSSPGDLGTRIVLLALGGMVLKGAVFPWLLFRAIREAQVRSEVDPFVGYALSILAGIAALALSVWLGSHLPLPAAVSSLAFPVALSTILSGLFVIVTRRKALSQVLGYLVLENGIYTFGVGFAQEGPLWVELGVLLDVFVAVFVMGIIIHHIRREFDSIDVHRISKLKD
jgi:hydrogenase-4 component E